KGRIRGQSAIRIPVTEVIPDVWYGPKRVIAAKLEIKTLAIDGARDVPIADDRQGQRLNDRVKENHLLRDGIIPNYISRLKLEDIGSRLKCDTASPVHCRRQRLPRIAVLLIPDASHARIVIGRSSECELIATDPRIIVAVRSGHIKLRPTQILNGHSAHGQDGRTRFYALSSP